MMEESNHITEIDSALIQKIIRPRPANGHKGTFGHALLIAGSTGKTGAAILAASAAMRTGCGLVSVHVSRKATTALMARLPEAMIIPRNKNSEGPEYKRFQAVGFGPGAGLAESIAQLLLELMNSYRQPVVIDADGITLLAQQREWYHLLSPQMILTPHPKEFDRLTKDHVSEEERFASQQQFARDYQCTVVLKGHRTTVCLPDGRVFRNTTGNSGMATAGSGDVLTGILTGLCAQGYAPEDAAVLGVFLHGFAGDDAARRLSQTSLLASDIIASIAAFFLQFEQVMSS